MPLSAQNFFASSSSLFGKEQEVKTDALVDGKKQTVTEKQLVYKFTTTVKDCTELSGDELEAYINDYSARIKPVAESGEAKADELGLTDTEKANNKTDMVNAFKNLDCSEDISAVAKCTVEVTLEDSTVVASQELYVVKIGNSWYVDNTNVDTSGLYLAK